MKLEVSVKVHELSHEDIVAIISGADSGISYWCCAMGLEQGVYAQYKKEGDCREDVQARAMLDGKCMVFVDCEDEREKYFLTYERLLKGVEQWLSKGDGFNFSGEFNGNEDSEDMDTIIQYALFDKIIFG